jgi:hypothetical protein
VRSVLRAVRSVLSDEKTLSMAALPRRCRIGYETGDPVIGHPAQELLAGVSAF